MAYPILVPGVTHLSSLVRKLCREGKANGFDPLFEDDPAIEPHEADVKVNPVVVVVDFGLR